MNFCTFGNKFALSVKIIKAYIVARKILHILCAKIYRPCHTLTNVISMKISQFIKPYLIFARVSFKNISRQTVLKAIINEIMVKIRLSLLFVKFLKIKKSSSF